MSSLHNSREGLILIPRPLHELKNHITHFRIPDFYAVARVVKVCVLAIFRGHFYDTDSILLSNATMYIHSLNGKVETLSQSPASRPFLLASGVAYSPKQMLFSDKIIFAQVAQLGSINLTNVVTYLGLHDPEFRDGALPWNHSKYELA